MLVPSLGNLRRPKSEAVPDLTHLINPNRAFQRPIFATPADPKNRPENWPRLSFLSSIISPRPGPRNGWRGGQKQLQNPAGFVFLHSFTHLIKQEQDIKTKTPQAPLSLPQQTPGTGSKSGLACLSSRVKPESQATEPTQRGNHTQPARQTSQTQEHASAKSPTHVANAQQQRAATLGPRNGPRKPHAFQRHRAGPPQLLLCSLLFEQTTEEKPFESHKGQPTWQDVATCATCCPTCTYHIVNVLLSHRCLAILR